MKLTQGYELLLRYNVPGEIESQTTQSLTEESEDDESGDDLGGQTEIPPSTTMDNETKKFIEGMSCANAKLICYNCGEEGHVSSACPKASRTDKGSTLKQRITMTTVGVKMGDDKEESDDVEGFGVRYSLNTIGLHQNITRTQQIVLANQLSVNDNWILLDNQSTT